MHAQTCLRYAAGAGKTEVCVLLLDTYPGLLDLPDKQGTFPLHMAACSGSSETRHHAAGVDVHDHAG